MAAPSPLTIVLATNNRDKVKEIRLALTGLPVTIKTKDDFPNFPDPEETGTTLHENALIKAKAIYQAFGLPALSDDSGLEVDALNGAPGVYSSRYAGENVTYADNCRKLIKEMQGIPKEKRTARFRCVIAMCWNEQDVEYADGVSEGYITEDMSGDKGFGYDPVFYSPTLAKRFSELTMEEKNQVSHRGRALAKAVTLIAKRLTA
jgi:XTP/dITP diphosphohydrolase